MARVSDEKSGGGVVPAATPRPVIPAKAGIQTSQRLPGEIAPVRIQAFDERELPRSVPFLQLFLAPNRRFHRRMTFKPDESRHGVARRETWNSMGSMDIHATSQIRSDADVEGSVPLACENVDGGTDHIGKTRA